MVVVELCACCQRQIKKINEFSIFNYYLMSKYSIQVLWSILYSLTLPQKHSNYSGNLELVTTVILVGMNGSMDLLLYMAAVDGQLNHSLHQEIYMYHSSTALTHFNQYKLILL